MKPSLKTTHPELFAQLHPTLNKNVNLDSLTSGSGRKLWWLGECGHEWEARLQSRTSQGSGCPYCAGTKTLSGFNDLATTNPELVSEWHPTKNGNLTPNSVPRGSRKKVWWQCSKGHEWLASLDSRGVQGSGCPLCLGLIRNTSVQEDYPLETTGFQVIKGENDLKSCYPQLAEEWDNADNSLSSEEIFRGGRTLGSWLCNKGHLYKAEVGKRIQGRGCPYCSGNKVLEGFNDLATTHPDIAAQWHPIKNSILSPSTVTAGSGKKVWWQCSKDERHEWEATVASRVAGNNCPICSNYVIVSGVNTLDITHPELANELHPSLNGDITANSITSGSGRRVYWQCSKKHVWNTRIVDRIYYGTLCPQCQSTSFSSKAEKDIANFVVNLGLSIQQNDRKLLNGQELDLYIPSKKLAIEFNGLYWHTERTGKHRTYHHDKWLKCKEKGVQLIQIWEDNWNRNPEQVKRMLAHKLGASQERKVFARKTSVVEVNKANAEQFLNENHIQGYGSGSYYLGLRDNEKDELIALLVLKNEPGTDGKTLNIIRYATSCNVVGGFTKLLKHAERTYMPEDFITFADHCVSDGGLYENNGFVADKILPPDYMYVVGLERKHKFGYRLKKFRDDPNLLWEEGLTERELAALNGLERIWDAGKTRYRYTV